MSRKPKDKSIDRKAIGSRIRQMRKELGMTQAQLAYKLGVKRPMVVKLEQGKFTDISLRVLIGLSKIIKKSIDWLINGS